MSNTHTRLRLHDWASVALLCTLPAAVVVLARGRFAAGIGLAAAAVVSLVVVRAGSVGVPGPMPFMLRWVLFLPRGPHSPEHLRKVLEPRPGERVLEIGPGIGVHSIPIAESLAPDGTLSVLDVQERMLAALRERAARAGVRNIDPTLGDAQRLPYEDASFDAAYLIGVLGEIPDPTATLRELRRVLRPTGRLVIGETILDPDYTRPSVLEARVRGAGFVLERRQGPRASYFSRFRPSTAT